jgi:Spy/CpxP family protein refolding chaperone
MHFSSHGSTSHGERRGGCGPRVFAVADSEGSQFSGFGGAFGVRRPLRFLAWKLGLDEVQVAGLATILNDLKTERAQSAVDDRRATSAFADLLGADAFDVAKSEATAQARAQSAERVQAAVSRALGQMHALLSPDQRAKLAYLIRTGSLAL